MHATSNQARCPAELMDNLFAFVCHDDQAQHYYYQLFQFLPGGWNSLTNDVVAAAPGGGLLLTAGHDGHVFAFAGASGTGRVADVTTAGWTPIEWTVPNLGAVTGLAVDPNGRPVLSWYDGKTAGHLVQRLNR